MTRWPKSVISAALAFGLLLIIGLGSGLFYPVFAGGPYKGRVIDSETKQSLEGAAVLVVWESVTPTIADKVYSYLDAEEVLTDSNGRFVVGKHPPMTFRPGWVDSPNIIIYYPGYGFYPDYHASPPIPFGGTDKLLKRMEKEELTIELPRLKTRQERIKVISGSYPTDVPPKKMPNLIRLLNIEAKAIGLPPAYTNPADSGVVSITSVTEGAVINDFSALVRGFVNVPFRTEVGVTVNGFVAFIDRGQFAVEVPVDNSVTGLTAVARDAMGVTLGSQTIPVTVQLPTTEPILLLRPSRAIGPAPLTVSFELGSLEPISRIDLDVDGNGTADFQGTTLDNQQFIYEGQGLYFPKVRVTDTANKIYTKTAILLVVAQNELEILLQSKWTALKNALRAGDIPSALNYIAISKRAYYGQVFSSLAVPIGQVLTDITFIEMAGATAEYQMVREDPEGRTAYMVRFVIDEDGIWRIRNF